MVQADYCCYVLDLGGTLSNLRNHVAGMSPENKGLAIGKESVYQCWRIHMDPHLIRLLDLDLIRIRILI
jgi:hypothetical protein